MSTDWWLKKLARQAPPPGPAAPPRTPASYAPLLPPGMGQDPARVVNTYLERHGVMQQPGYQPPAPVSPASQGLMLVGQNEAYVPHNPMAPHIDGDPNEYHRRLW